MSQDKKEGEVRIKEQQVPKPPNPPKPQQPKPSTSSSQTPKP